MREANILDGSIVSAGAGYKKLRILETVKFVLFEERSGSSSPTVETVGFPAWFVMKESLCAILDQLTVRDYLEIFGWLVCFAFGVALLTILFWACGDIFKF